VRAYKDRYVIIGDIEVTIFSLAQMLVGMEKSLMDMACGEEYVIPLSRPARSSRRRSGCA
jgi:uroporphyrinogen decarboxylase